MSYTPGETSYRFIVFCPRCRRAAVFNRAWAVHMQERNCVVCSDALGFPIFYESVMNTRAVDALRSSLHFVTGF